MIFENDKPRLREQFAETYEDNGAIRWKSSDNAVPGDIMNFWFEEGFINRIAVLRTETARKRDNEAAIAAYIVARDNMTEEQKAEEAAERRAAFGPGENVVNILTGESFTT